MKTILFYGQEDRERLEAIVPAERYAQLRSDLKSLIEPFLNGHLAYIPGPDTISPDHYFDYVHIDKKGYEMLLNTLWPQIEAWTCPATRPGSD